MPDTPLESVVPTPGAEHSLTSDAVYTSIPENVPLVDGPNNSNGHVVYSYVGQEETLNPQDMLVGHGPALILHDRTDPHEITQSYSNRLYEELKSSVRYTVIMIRSLANSNCIFCIRRLTLPQQMCLTWLESLFQQRF